MCHAKRPVSYYSIHLAKHIHAICLAWRWNMTRNECLHLGIILHGQVYVAVLCFSELTAPCGAARATALPCRMLQARMCRWCHRSICNCLAARWELFCCKLLLSRVVLLLLQESFAKFRFFFFFFLQPGRACELDIYLIHRWLCALVIIVRFLVLLYLDFQYLRHNVLWISGQILLCRSMSATGCELNKTATKKVQSPFFFLPGYNG